jgi:hypothetical protein
MKGYIKYTCKYFIMFKENLWPNFVSEHPMIFSMFCHQTFVNVCSQTWLRHVYGIYITSASSVKLYSILSQQFANVAASPVKDLTIVCLMLQKLFYIPALWIWDLQPTVWILMSWSKIISPALSLFATNLSISLWHCPSWAVVWAYATDHDTWDEDHCLQLHKTVILNPSIVIHIHKIVPMYLRSRVRTTFICTPSTTIRNSLQQNSLLCCHKLSKETESTMECPLILMLLWMLYSQTAMIQWVLVICTFPHSGLLSFWTEKQWLLMQRASQCWWKPCVYFWTHTCICQWQHSQFLYHWILPQGLYQWLW